MLHEGLGSLAQWGDFPDQVVQATGCGVFLYSRAGYGGSDPVAVPRPLSYMHDEALTTLPPLLDAIGFERGILLGHSDGASIATIYAGGVQDHRVRGLVLIAPHSFVEPIALAGIAAAQLAYEAGPLRQRLARYHGDNVDCAFWGWSRAWMDPNFRDWNIRPSLRRVSVPMLVMQGSDDEYATMAQLESAQEEARAPITVAEIPNARHAPHLQRAGPTLSAITEFVSTVLQTSGATKQIGRPLNESLA
jgi:pimeloyl-ACP methyl ester carboxylesterase